MTPLYLWNGMLLTENGALAISQDCCCFPPCCSCPDGYPLLTIPGIYGASVTYDTSYGEDNRSFIFTNPAWSEFISCYGLNWSSELPALPPIVRIECSDGFGSFEWDYFEYSPTYYYEIHDLNQAPQGLYDSQKGIFYTYYAEFYLDVEVLSSEYQNCNIFALLHTVNIDAHEYKCFEQLQNPIRLTKNTQSSKICIQIVQILPEECDLEEPAPVNAMVRDITSEVLLSGTIGTFLNPVVSSTLTNNCTELFLYNQVNTYNEETGWDYQFSNTEPLDNHLPPKYPDPIVVETLAICATGCEEVNKTLPVPAGE